VPGTVASPEGIDEIKRWTYGVEPVARFTKRLSLKRNDEASAPEERVARGR
jgi:hypothetical protein